MNNPFINPKKKPDTKDGIYDDAERGLANRNSGTLLETLALDKIGRASCRERV